MNYKAQLQCINEKYYDKIKSAYGCYIKNFDKIPNMTQKIYIIPDAKCRFRYKSLSKVRGKCTTKNGKIYIRESAFCEQVLVHEYIHRLSRNFKKIGYIKWGWVEGVMYLDRKVCYRGINEVLTEWLAYNITGIKEDTTYTRLFSFIDDLQQHPEIFKNIIKAYFSSDKEELTASLYNIYKLDTYIKINQLDMILTKLTELTVS